MTRQQSPTVTTIFLFVLVFGVQTVAGLFGRFPGLFVLQAPVGVTPWTIVTSVYAHASVQHLAANSVALLIPGLLLERQTSRVRYHTFFVTSGAIAGLAQVTIGGLVGPAEGVLGASGAVFAVIGYLMTGNRLAEAALGGVRLSGRVQLLAFGIIAVGITLATGAPGVALIAHFTGLFVGLVAGSAHVLRVD